MTLKTLKKPGKVSQKLLATLFMLVLLVVYTPKIKRYLFQIKPTPSAANIESNDAIYTYDEVDSEVIRCYQVMGHVFSF